MTRPAHASNIFVHKYMLVHANVSQFQVQMGIFKFGGLSLKDSLKIRPYVSRFTTLTKKKLG